MKIDCVDLRNFRKLANIRVRLSSDTTLFVGPNNSGKSTAMEALRRFIDSDRAFALTDFSLTSFEKLEKIGLEWEASEAEIAAGGTPSEGTDNDEFWESVLPTLDLWISADEGEMFRSPELLPTIEDYPGGVGVRLRLQPRDFAQFKRAYLNKRVTLAETLSKDPQKDSAATPRLWPAHLPDFMRKELGRQFTVQAYKLDPSAVRPQISFNPEAALDTEGSTSAVEAQPIALDARSIAVASVRRLIQIDFVEAQRGLGTPSETGHLSEQVAIYYAKHLDPSNSPAPEDLQAIRAGQAASTAFGERLNVAFKNPLLEISKMGYPGGFNPRVVIRTTLELTDGLKHRSVLRYRLDDADDTLETHLELPEELNGLGYQNLVLMMFNLMSFRDSRMNKGKAAADEDGSWVEIKPIHLVLVEEPEAHLHAQVQQAFVRSAHQTLNDYVAPEGSVLSTQLVVSTHSSHVAHEMPFDCIRYFRREKASSASFAPTSTVRDLTGTFGSDDETARFVRRYLKLNHCNIFFADAIIAVEGAAERILVPHFVESGHNEIAESYVEYLEVGGAHVHRLRSLIERLGIPALVITDIDAYSTSKPGKARPELGKGLESSNPSLASWLTTDKTIDGLTALNVTHEVVAVASGVETYFAYQAPVDVFFSSKNIGNAFPSTFEDAFALSNLDALGRMKGIGLLKKFSDTARSASTSDALTVATKLYEHLQSDQKAKFALDVLWELPQGDSFVTPPYIEEGLKWLEARITRQSVADSAVDEVPAENLNND
jgi:predicted ATP-dependent endonuclease of OLD family